MRHQPRRRVGDPDALRRPRHDAYGEVLDVGLGARHDGCRDQRHVAHGPRAHQAILLHLRLRRADALEHDLGLGERAPVGVEGPGLKADRVVDDDGRPGRGEHHSCDRRGGRGGRILSSRDRSQPRTAVVASVSTFTTDMNASLRAGGAGQDIPPTAVVESDPRSHLPPSCLEPPCSPASVSTDPISGPGPCTIGPLGDADDDHGRGLPDLLRQGRGGGTARRRGHPTARDDQQRRAPRHRAGVARPRRRLGLRRHQEAVPRRVHARRCRGRDGDVVRAHGRPRARQLALRALARRRGRQLRVLRGAPAAHRPEGGDRPRLDRRVRPGLRRRGHPARAQPGLDPEAGLVRAAGRPRAGRERGDPPGPAGVRQRGGLVAAVLDPAVPAVPEPPARLETDEHRGPEPDPGRVRPPGRDLPRAPRLPAGLPRCCSPF